MNVTEEQVKSALSHVFDPDLHKDLITLKMIENIKIEKNTIQFDLVLTTPACPMKSRMKQDCELAIHNYIDPEVEVIVNFSSNVTSKRHLSKDEILPTIKNIIAVASGKGGVGKSTIAVNLALQLSKAGAKVALVDADIYGPSLPLMFGLEDVKPEVIERDGKQVIIPIEKFGIKVQSIGFFVSKDQALIWRGPMASNAMKQMFTDTQWGEIDYMVVDLPPGTGDIHLTMVQDLPVTGAVIVTTPSKLALADVKKAISMFQTEKISIPILGIVENMTYFAPAEFPDKKYYIFGQDGGKLLAEELHLELLSQIPLVLGVTESVDSGNPIVLDENSPLSSIFSELASKVAQQAAVHNANKN
ncbi:MAG: Mrp/NBP35 family ATP-binding protein [Bacteroidota bacterium]